MNAPTFELTMTRYFRAPREKVWDAFVDPALMSAWMCPRGMSGEVRATPQVGGDYRLQMSARDGTRFTAIGRYVELDRPRRVAYTWGWEGGQMLPEGLQTLIEVELSERDGGTELVMRHSGLPDAASRDGHAAGWTSCLNRLNDAVDARGSAATLTLLGDARSTYTRTARMAFAEKGVAVTLQPTAPHSPEVLAVHPFGRIPALTDGPIAIWETSAIVRYADEAFGVEAMLTPGRIADRVVCDQWVSAVHCYLYDTMVRRYVLQYLFPRGAGGTPDRGVIDNAVAEMDRQLTALEKAYTGREYLAGGALSHADLFVAPILAYVERFDEGRRLLSDRPNVRRAQAVLRARPSFPATEPAA
jgi:glutathione S-transferase